jgi:vancomycin permeability regulator SanA
MENGTEKSRDTRAVALLDNPRTRAPLMVVIMLTPLLLVLPLLALCAFLVSNLVVSRGGNAHSVEGVPEAPHAYVAIVLGARVYPNGNPSPMLVDRLETGFELYRTGKVQKILVSGDHGQHRYDETNTMRNYLLARGMPSEDVFMDHAGFSTYDTMYRAREVFLVKDALVVTQRFHLARAVYTARRLGLEAVGVPADLRPYADERRFVVRDWFARVKAFFDVNVLRPAPRYLGPVIPITGDGRATEG